MTRGTTLKVNRKSETINIKDEDGNVLYEWAVPTDDASMQKMLNRVSNAFIRAKSLSDKQAEASTPEELREIDEQTVKLQKRTISAIIGEDGYRDILEYIGDGEPVDPHDYIMTIGDIFGSLCMWLYDRCTFKQLREAGVYFESEQKRTNGRWVPNGAGKRKKGQRK